MTEWFFNLNRSRSKTSYGTPTEINPFVILNKKPKKNRREEFEKIELPSESPTHGLELCSCNTTPKSETLVRCCKLAPSRESTCGGEARKSSNKINTEGEKDDVSEFVVVLEFNDKNSTYKSHVVNLNSKKNKS